jgi:RNA polymerase sigma factor (sigma-70 family)
MPSVNLKPEEYEPYEHPAKSRTAPQSRSELPSSQPAPDSDSSAVTCLSRATSDDLLVQLCLAGVREAFHELERRFRQDAFGVGYYILGNAADAADVVQEGFTNAYTRLCTFRGQSAFKTWLLTLVRNAALTLGRKRSCYQTKIASFATMLPPEKSRTPLDDLIAKERKELADCFLQERVTIRWRLIYKLRVEEGLTYTQIAQRVKWIDARKARYLIVEKLLPALLNHVGRWE